MKQRFRSIAMALFVFLVIALCVRNLAVAASPVRTPFQAGKTYRLEFLGADATITVITPPDSNGWATVTVIKGLSGQASGTTYLNTRLAVTATEIE